MLQPTKDLAEAHYHDLSERPFFPRLTSYLSSAPVVAMVWEGEDIVKQGRAMIGATSPLASAPGTIRGDLSIVVENKCVRAASAPAPRPHSTRAQSDPSPLFLPFLSTASSTGRTRSRTRPPRSSCGSARAASPTGRSARTSGRTKRGACGRAPEAPLEDGKERSSAQRTRRGAGRARRAGRRFFMCRSVGSVASAPCQLRHLPKKRATLRLAGLHCRCVWQRCLYCIGHVHRRFVQATGHSGHRHVRGCYNCRALVKLDEASLLSSFRSKP